MECSLCNLCYHFNCISLTLADYKYFKSSSLGWNCQTCSKSIFPFHSIEDNELVKLSFNSNLSCLCSKNTVSAILEDLPMLQTISNIGNIPHLSNFDPECNTPCAICNKLIRSNGRKLECSLCNLCYHFNCTSLTPVSYTHLTLPTKRIV